jgi:voltage-gated potassium channel Kch
MTDDNQYAVIAGFGLPGRSVAESLDHKHIPYCVIERNVQTVSRCLRAGIRIIEGDVTDPQILERAEIRRATLYAIAIPDEDVMLKAVEVARALNPTCRIIARCMYTSAGMKALTAGATEVVIAEKAVAAEFSRLLDEPPKQ